MLLVDGKDNDLVVPGAQTLLNTLNLILDSVGDCDLAGDLYHTILEGDVDPGVVADLAERLAAAGAGEVVLADTIGVATPRPVARLVERVSILGVAVGGHFHDTRHTGVASAWAAVEAGATVLDASVGGLGGCPFAPRATGNVATEDVLYLLERERVETGVDLEALIDVARWLEELLGRELPGRVYRA